MRQRVFQSVLAAAMMAAPIAASADPVVVELYTSQGCSACPPADRNIGDLAQRSDVIALSLHVDYWDYLGWKDGFASPEHTTRQKAYAATHGSTMIFTPQVIVGGQDSVSGSRGMKIVEKVQAHSGGPDRARVTLSRQGPQLSIALEPLVALTKPMDIYVVQFSPAETVAIRSGENAGKSLTYHNVVRDWRMVGQWDGAAASGLKVEAMPDLPIAVIVQEGSLGPVVAASRID